MTSYTKLKHGIKKLEDDIRILIFKPNSIEAMYIIQKHNFLKCQEDTVMYGSITTLED